MSAVRNILYYCPYDSGHHKEYLNHLLNYVDNKETSFDQLFFIVKKGMLPLLKKATPRGTSIVWLSDEDHSDWSVLLQNYSIDMVCFMYLDKYLQQPQLLKLIHSKGVHIMGIYFRPYNRIFDPHGLNLLKYAYQRLKNTYALVRCMPYLSRILVLNEASFSERTRLIIQAAKVRYIQDPIESNYDEPSFNFYEQFTRHQGKSKFLLFGSQDKRKNTNRFLEAIEKSPIEQLERIQVYVIGKHHDPSYLASCQQIATSINHKSQQQTVIVYNAFISEEEKTSCFHFADYIVIPYVDFFFSSGILLHAIKFRKAILATDLGYIGETVKKYGLGVVCNPHSINSMKKGVLEIMQSPYPSEQSFERYFKKNNHSKENFAQKLLLLNDPIQDIESV